MSIMHTARMITTLAILLVAGRETAFALDKVIVVLRHGDDTTLVPAGPERPSDPNYPKSYWHSVNPNWPNYPRQYTLVKNGGTIPATLDGSTISVQKFGLSEAGANAAKQLALKLPAFLVSKNSSPITRAITKTPIPTVGIADPTPNPFDTLWPMIKSGGPFPSAKLLLIKQNLAGGIVDTGLVNLIIQNALLPTDGSTLLLWDKRGLWGDNSSSLDSRSVLSQLGSQWGSANRDYIKRVGVPLRCATIYIFRPNNILKIYSFDYLTGNFTSRT